MMTGAESKRRLDFDADAVCRNTGAIVCAVNDEPAGDYRTEASQAVGDPILHCEALKVQRRGRSRSGCCGNQIANGIFVERRADVE